MVRAFGAFLHAFRGHPSRLHGSLTLRPEGGIYVTLWALSVLRARSGLMLDTAVLGQVDLAGQLFQEIRPFKALHDRALHLGQVESNPAVLEPVVNSLQAFQRRGVNRIHR